MATTFAGAFEAYVQKIKGYSGMHYVPSFNDLNSMCSDDVERVDSPRKIPVRSSESLQQAGVIPVAPYNTSTYERSSFELTDLHKVNRPANSNPSAKSKFDIPRVGDSATIWTMMERNSASYEQKQKVTPEVAEARQADLTSHAMSSHKTADPTRTSYGTADIHMDAGRRSSADLGRQRSAKFQFDIPRKGDKETVWDMVEKGAEQRL